MTLGDIQFLKNMGIEPCSLKDPCPNPSPPSPPAEAPIPKLAEKDSRWLQDLRVAWEHEPELEFVPPKTLQEYLGRFPDGIREAVCEVTQEMGLALQDGCLDDLAQDIVAMFLEFSTDLEDVVEMYPLHPPMHPGGVQVSALPRLHQAPGEVGPADAAQGQDAQAGRLQVAPWTLRKEAG